MNQELQDRLLTVALAAVLLFFAAVVVVGLYTDCATLSDWGTVAILTCGLPFFMGRPFLFLIAPIVISYFALAAVFGWWPSNRK
jgi:hypothetical protein